MSIKKKEKKHPKILDFASGTLAVAGIILLNGHKFIPNAVIGNAIRTVGFVFYLASYASWLAAVYFYPDLRKERAWYGFTDIKKQNVVASIVGFLGVVCLLLSAIVFPPLLIASGWLLVISDVFWVMSEYQKYKVLHDTDNKAEAHQQHNYTVYSSLILSGSIISAISFSLMTAFPLYITTISMLSLLSVAVLTTFALSFWVASKCQQISPDEQALPDAEPSTGRKKMTSKPKDIYQRSNEPYPPMHFSSLPFLAKNHDKSGIVANNNLSYSPK